MDDWTESQWKNRFNPQLGWQDVDMLLPADSLTTFYPLLTWQDINASVPECGGDGASRPESGIVYP